jgi:phosphoglycolate phosphatase-like HAD superfamily hydrolase
VSVGNRIICAGLPLAGQRIILRLDGPGHRPTRHHDPMTNRLHLIWDWNGTVLDDFDVAFLSTNRSFRDAGLAEITTATYRELLQTPIRAFYAAVVGRDLSDEEYDSIESAFRTYYPLYEKQAVLSSGLPDLFRQWHDAGHTQSLLSLLPHDKLVPAVERHGLTSYFALVQGATLPYPDQKAVANHLAILHVDPADAAMIGDLADDARAAQQAGVSVVPYSGGFGDPAYLAATGAPVAASLAEAVELIGGLITP